MRCTARDMGVLIVGRAVRAARAGAGAVRVGVAVVCAASVVPHASAAVPAGPALSAPGAPDARDRVASPDIVLAGDLDTMKLAADVRAALAGARAEAAAPNVRPGAPAGAPANAPLAAPITLELRGVAFRRDVLLELVRTLRAADRPVRVVLRAGAPDDPRVGAAVGAGHLLLALAASQRAVEPGVRVVLDEPESLRDLAPTGTRWAGVRDELVALLAPGGAAVPREALLALLEPEAALWLARVEGAPGLRVLTAPPEVASGVTSAAWVGPAGGSGAARATSRVGAFTPVIDGAGLIALGLFESAAPAAPIAPAPGRVAPPRGNPPRPAPEPSRERAREPVLIMSSLAPAREQAADALRVAREALDGVERTLDLPDPARREIAPARYRRAAEAARPEVARAVAALDALDALLADVPEVLRTPPPGEVTAGARASSFPARWRTLLRRERERVEEAGKTIDRFVAV